MTDQTEESAESAPLREGAVPRLAVDGLDALPTPVAVLDSAGTVAYANWSWRATAAEGSPPSPDPGDDYLALCEDGAAIRAVLDGEVTSAAVTPESDDAAASDRDRSSPDRTRLRVRSFVYEGERHALLVRRADRPAPAPQVRDTETLGAIGRLAADLAGSLFDVGSRAAIEELVGSRITDLEAYEAAWTVSGTPDDLEVRATAGAADPAPELPDDVRRIADRALADGAPAIRRRSGGLALLATPVVHQETVLGGLVVAADRPGAFGASERAVLAGLGEAMGEAINAIRNRNVVTADAVAELRYEVGPDASVLARAAAALDSRLELAGVVPVTGAGTLAYLRVPGSSAEAFVDLVDEEADLQSVRQVGTRGEDVVFECRLADDAPLAAVASQGVNVTSGVADPDDLTVVTEADTGVDVRALTQSLRTAIPEIELVARRKRDRRSVFDERPRIGAAELTDRQNEVVEAAYRAGYFSWPRETSGEDLAAAFGISPPTFHQHLRVGLEKLLESVYGPEENPERGTEGRSEETGAG